MWKRDHMRESFRTPLIGMVHCRPLPGAPGWAGDMDAVETAALRDADALAEGGAGAILVENYHDTPFYSGRVPAETVAALTRIAVGIRRVAPELPLGINVLRNDVLSALGIAAAVGASFVRVNVLTGATVTDQGLIQGDAAVVLRLRRSLAPQVGILADLRVKHGAPLAPRALDEEAADLRRRARADALIVSGAATGAPADPAEVAAARAAEPDCPLLIGSGVTIDNVEAFALNADGFIVGSSLQVRGEDGWPRIARDRVAELVSAL
jgi:hypothetical protein